MKGLDTSILLGLLHGAPGAREWLRRLRGVEVATTEANLLELAIITAEATDRVRKTRRDALSKLRRRITVLPIDHRSVEDCANRLGRAALGASVQVLAMMGALEANGCDELFTLDPPSALGKWTLRVTRIQFA